MSVAVENALAAAMSTWASASGDPNAIKTAAIQAANAARNAVVMPAYATYNGARANNAAMWVDTVAPAYTTNSNESADHALTAANTTIDASKTAGNSVVDNTATSASAVIPLAQGKADSEVDSAVAWTTTATGAGQAAADANTDNGVTAFNAEIDALKLFSDQQADHQHTEILATNAANVQAVSAIGSAIAAAISGIVSSPPSTSSASSTQQAASTAGTGTTQGSGGTTLIDGMTLDEFVKNKIYPLMTVIQSLQARIAASNDPAFKQALTTSLLSFQNLLAIEQAKIGVAQTSQNAGVLPPMDQIDIGAAGRPGFWMGLIPIYGSAASLAASIDEGSGWGIGFHGTILVVELTGVGAVAKLSYKFFMGRSGFGALSEAGKYGIKSYSDLIKLMKGTNLQAHHLIEKRFAGVLGSSPGSMLSVGVTKAEHQIFTNAWRKMIPYGEGTANATREQIMKAAREIYKDYPDILKALGL